MLRVADGLSVLSKGIGKVGLRLPYDYMVAAMPYVGLPIVFDSGLSGILSDFIFGKDGDPAEIMAHLQANDNRFDPRTGEEVLPSEETLNLKAAKHNPFIYPEPIDASKGNIGNLKGSLPKKQRAASFSRWFANNLSEWHSRPAQQEMYYVTFDIPEKIKNYVVKGIGAGSVVALEDTAMPEDNLAFQLIDTDNLMETEFLGCYFVTGITTPVDALTIGFTDRPEGQRHLSPNLIIEDRKFDHLTSLSIRFMETNVSIVDTFLRPWLKVLGHLGLTEDDFKCNITVHQLAKNSAGGPPLQRKRWTYFGAFPINISEQELQRGAKSSLTEYQVTWGFRSYELVNYQNYWGKIATRPIGSDGIISNLV